MKLNQTLALIASFTTALQLATAGNITGKVTLKGTRRQKRKSPVSQTQSVARRTLHR